jgi:hypothetical protein
MTLGSDKSVDCDCAPAAQDPDRVARRPCQTTDLVIEPIAVTIPQAVRISGLSRSEIYRRLAAGDIDAIKSGTRALILVDSIKRYLASLPTAQYRGPKAA